MLACLDKTSLSLVLPQGGRGGVEVLWRPPAGEFARARGETSHSLPTPPPLLLSLNPPPPPPSPSAAVLLGGAHARALQTARALCLACRRAFLFLRAWLPHIAIVVHSHALLSDKREREREIFERKEASSGGGAAAVRRAAPCDPPPPPCCAAAAWCWCWWAGPSLITRT